MPQVCRLLSTSVPFQLAPLEPSVYIISHSQIPSSAARRCSCQTYDSSHKFCFEGRGEHSPPTSNTKPTDPTSGKLGSMDGPSSSLPPEAIELAGRMYDAARAGDLATFQQALPAGLPANLTNEKGDTLLMLAAYYGHAELVRLLIQHGADPNRLNDKNQSPLAGAVFKKEDAVIEALLEGGADPEYGNPNAMQCVAMFKQEETWKAKFDAAPGRGKAKEPAQGPSL